MLTHRQREVFEYLKRCVAERGFPPTVAETAHYFGMRSQNAAAQHLRLIAQKGFIEIEPGRSRGIRIMDRDAIYKDAIHRDAIDRETAGAEEGVKKDVVKISEHNTKSDLTKISDPTKTQARERSMIVRERNAIPIVGRVAAGAPILAEENHDGTFLIDREAFARRIDYLLRVSGDSMIGAGIQNGDFVAVHRTPEARDGEIAVVRVGGDSSGEVTVKRIRRRGEILTLIPENPRLRPVDISLKEESVSIEGVVVGLIRTRIDGN